MVWALVGTSHPVWVRGLKLCWKKDIPRPINVAPRVGAWIETSEEVSIKTSIHKVAPRVGAWIETEI